MSDHPHSRTNNLGIILYGIYINNLSVLHGTIFVLGLTADVDQLVIVTRALVDEKNRQSSNVF